MPVKALPDRSSTCSSVRLTNDGGSFPLSSAPHPLQLRFLRANDELQRSMKPIRTFEKFL